VTVRVEQSSRRGLRVVLLVGLLYLVIGVVFAALGRAGGVASRLAAWAVSALVFAAHIGYGLTRVGNTPRTTALHAGLAAALGAFGLAVSATLHAVAASSYRGAYAIALVAWPILTGLPAFLVALALAAGLSLLRRSDER